MAKIGAVTLARALRSGSRDAKTQARRGPRSPQPTAHRPQSPMAHHRDFRYALRSIALSESDRRCAPCSLCSIRTAQGSAPICRLDCGRANLSTERCGSL